VQEHSRWLMTPDEIRRLGAGELLVITGNRRPLRIEKTSYDAAPCSARTVPLGEARTVPIAFTPPPTKKAPSPPPPLPPDPEQKSARTVRKGVMKFTPRKSARA